MHVFAQNNLIIFATVGAVDRAQEEDATAGNTTVTDLSIFTRTGPKLEDFLGCSTTTAPPSQQPQHPPPPPPPPSVQSLCPFPTETPVTNASDTSEIYDSELKTIAASFLRGFSSTTEQTDTTQKQQSIVQTESAPRKTVDTFGQRTSIFRGVTR